MFLDKVTQNMSNLRRNLILGIFIFLVAMPSFFSGEWSKWLQAAIFVAVALLIAYMVIYYRQAGFLIVKRGEKIFSSPNCYLIIFIAILLITSFFSVNKYFSFSLLFLFASFVAVYFSAYYFFREWRLIKIITNVILITGVVASLISLIMFLNQSDNRGMGLLFNANALGSYLLFSLPLGIVLTINYFQTKLRFLYLACTVMICLGFFLTYSYTGWVSFLLPLILLVGYFRKVIFRRRSVVIICVILLVAFLSLAAFRYNHSRNITEAVQIYKTIPYNSFIFSFSQRLNFDWSALEMFTQRPMSGWGYNTFQMVYSRFAHTLLEQPRYTHNYYLQTLAETGLFGFLAFIAFVCLLFRRIYRGYQAQAATDKKLYFFGLSLGVTASAIHALFDFGWQFPAVFVLFWLISGLLMGWSKTTADDGFQTTAGQSAEAPKEDRWKIVAQSGVIIIALIIFIRGLTLFLGANYFQKAELGASEGNYKAAISNYDQALKYDPDTEKLANYINDMAKYSQFLSAERLDELQAKAQRALEANPEYYYCHWALGRLYFSLSKISEAEREYKQAILYNPVFRPDFYYDLAFVYFQNKDYEQSKKTILTILEKYTGIVSSSNPNLPTQLAFLNLMMGENYLAQGQTVQAKIYYQAALNLYPDFKLAQTKLKNLE